MEAFIALIVRLRRPVSFLPVALLMLGLFAGRGVYPAHAQATLPVVLVNGITADTTWYADTVYYIQNDITIPAGCTLTIQGGAVVKFWVPYLPDEGSVLYLTVNGSVVFEGTSENPVLITSGRDDSPEAGGDTNGDANQTFAAPGDWGGIILVDRQTEVTNLISRYGLDGVAIRNTSDDSNNVIAPTIHDNTFAYNHCGLTLLVDIGDYGRIESIVEFNDFVHNEYGFCTRLLWNHTSAGLARPTLQNNNFQSNSILPIHLKGGGYPVYGEGSEANTFSGTPDPNDKLGIGLSGYFYNVGTWPRVNQLPYVVINPVEITAGASVSLPAGSVVKFFTTRETPVGSPLPELRIIGNLNLQSTEEEPIIFTSYHDDSVFGDTNGDDSDTEPYANDWSRIYFKDDHVTGDANFTFQYLSFRYAQNGLWYEATRNGQTRRPNILDCSFIGNRNGLRFKVTSINSTSRLEPVIENNLFQRNGFIPKTRTDLEPGTPIFLENTVDPLSYAGNTFVDNLHLAIGVMGEIRSDVTWTAVPGQGIPNLPYLVHGRLKVGPDQNGPDDSFTLTLPAGTVVKFNVNKFEANYKSSMLATARLVINSMETAPVVFTSYYDDHLHNTSADGITPTRTDWDGVIVRNSNSAFLHTIFRYGMKALHIENKRTDGIALNPAVGFSTFEENDFGLYLNIQDDANITSDIYDNAFIRNNYGLGTFATGSVTCPVSNQDTGISLPVLSRNHFEDHAMFPIFLNGAASPTYTEESGVQTNTFIYNDHPAIALGGYFGSPDSIVIRLPAIPGDSNPPTNGQTLPYVILQDTVFDRTTRVEMDGGLVFKGDTAKGIHFYGRLAMDTAFGRENYFTSYRDDESVAGGDTNGTPTPNPLPARGDWDGIYLHRPGPGTGSTDIFFNYATMRYSTDGLSLFQDKCSPGDITGMVSHNDFLDNTNGMKLVIESELAISPTIFDNAFANNEYGLRTYSNPSQNLMSYGIANPILQNNRFAGHTGFPIYLQGTANPTYMGNEFWNNVHKAIAVGGMWVQDATWTSVPGDEDTETSGHIFPYVIFETVDQWWAIGPEPPTMTVPANTIIKVNNDKYFYVGGFLDLQSSPGNEVIFTSYHDDTYAGDTNYATTTPTRTSWKTVWLLDWVGKTNHIHDVKAFYATAAFGIYHYGEDPETQIIPTIVRGEFAQNHAAIAACIGWIRVNVPNVGWVTIGGKAGIEATLDNLDIHDNNYGVLTTGHRVSTGIIYLDFKNVTFENTAVYPLFLGYTAYPSFDESNQIRGGTLMQGIEGFPGLSPQNAELSILPSEEELPEAALETMVNRVSEPSPAERIEQAPPPANEFTNESELYPAVGLAGAWNNSGELPALDNIPFIVAGGFPLTVIADGESYLPANDVTVGDTNPDMGLARVTIPAGSIFKLGKVGSNALKIVVKGGLNLLSTATNPIIFTSVHDDSAGGDTNKNGAATLPHTGDWGDVQLTTSSTEFHHSIMRYATKGLHVYFDGPLMQNINPWVHDNIFTLNTTGLTLSAVSGGDILSTIEDNRFNLNTNHIVGSERLGGSLGKLCVEVHQNDLLGQAGQTGINNLNTNTGCDFDAINNFWGHASGPHHPSLNPNGHGTEVSDRVLFNPWMSAALFPSPLLTIQGRVTVDTTNGDGLAGVVVALSTGDKDTTDSGGYYSFDDLEPGPYTIVPSHSGYAFDPPYQVINNLQSDATVNFIATTVISDYWISIDPYTSVLAPVSGTANVKVRVAVHLNKPLASGQTATVEYFTQDGSALNGIDYVGRSGVITFRWEQPMVQYIEIDVKPISDPSQSKYFNVLLRNSGNASIDVGAGTVIITSARKVFIPIVRR